MNDRNPTPKVEINYEDDPLAAWPYQLENLASGGPIGFWRMEALTGTTEQDQTANNRDLTYVNAPTLGVEGALVDQGDTNPAVSFNGTDERAETAASSTWQNLHAAWTLGAWIYPTASRTGLVTLAGIVTCEEGAGTPTPFFLLYGENQFAGTGASRVMAGFDEGPGHRIAWTPTSPTLNTWSFVVATWDGTTITIYKDGVSVATNTPGVTNVAASGTCKLFVGFQDAHPQGTTDYFPGRIDEPFVFDYVLQDTQIASLYQRYLSVRTLEEANFVDLSALDDTDVYGREIPRLRNFSMRRGRSDPTSRIEAGQATLVLSNLDGALFPAEPVNRLANPSAEAADEEFLPFVARDGTQAIVFTPVRTGERSWSLTTDGTSPAYLTTQRDGLVGMRPGEEVVFSAYVHVTTAGNVDLADVTPQIVYEVAGVETVVDGGNPGSFDSYQRVQVTTTIPADADVAYARIELDAGAGAETIYVDDVQLELGDTATTYCDGDQTDCDWLGEAHKSMSLRKRAGSPSVKVALPMRKIRVQGTWDGEDYGVYHGYLQRPQFSFPSAGQDSIATYSVVDGTAVLAKISMRGFSRSAELVGPRVRAILAFAGIAPTDIDVDDNFIEINSLSAQAAVADDRSALSMIREIEETERGEFFVSRDGLFTYQGSLARSIEEQAAIVLTDEDDTGAVRYRDLAMTIDIATVANDVHIENVSSSNDHHFIYPLSQQRFFPITASEQSNWAQDTATDDPRPAPFPVAESVQVQAFRDPTIWPTVLGLELGDLARIQRIHNGIDIWQGYVHFLEGISLNASPTGGWVYDYLTSPYPVSPFTASTWQTPISKPQLLTSKSAFGSGTPVVLPSASFVTGRTYVIYAGMWASGGATPTLPTITSANTWTNLDNASSTGLRHATWYTVATSTVTEALSFAFGTPPNSVYDIVVLEIVEGFDATPIGDHPGTQTGGQTSGQNDVGTLTDDRSAMLIGIAKAANAIPSLVPATIVYNRAGPGSTSYYVAYASTPGIDTIAVDWGGAANGWSSIAIEIEAS